MAKKHHKNPSQPASEQPETAENTGYAAGWADVHSAADALRLAKAEVFKAQELCQQVRHEAAERVEAVRNTTVGDMLDGALDTVRKHPGAGMAVALAVGVFLGRIMKR